MPEYNNDPDYHEVIRQRRIAAGLLLGLSLVAFTLLGGGEFRPMGWLLDDDTGVYAAGDPYSEWIYAECDGEQQQITVLKDGHLSGVQGLDSLRSVSLPDWCDLPMVDNQNLGLWDAKLARLNDVTRDDSYPASTVLDTALDLPLSSLYLQPISRWLDDDPQHGPALLDAVAARIDPLASSSAANNRAARDNFSLIINRATQQALSLDLDNDRIQSWLRSPSINANEEVLFKLARMENDNPAVSLAVLDHLDKLPQRQRDDVYQRLAERLLVIPGNGLRLAQALDDLPRDERLPVVRSLLLIPDLDPEYPRHILANFDDLFYGEQTELDAFNAIAETIRDDQDAPRLLARVLPELSDLQRRQAAIHMVELDRGEQTRFTLAVLDEFDELHEQSKPRVVDAILRAPQFSDAEVQRRTVNAIADEVSATERRDLLRRVEDHPRASDETRSSVEFLLQ